MAELVHTTVNFDVTGGGFCRITPVPFNNVFEFDDEYALFEIVPYTERCHFDYIGLDNNGSGNYYDVTDEVRHSYKLKVSNDGQPFKGVKVTASTDDGKVYTIATTLNNCVCYPTPHEGQIAAVVETQPYIYFKPTNEYDSIVATLDGEPIDLTYDSSNECYYYQMNDIEYEEYSTHALNVNFKPATAQHTVTATLHFANGTEGTMEYSVEDGGEIEIDGKQYMKKTDALKKSVVDGKDVTYEAIANNYSWKFTNVHEDHTIELWLFTPTAKQQGLAMQLAGAFAAIGNNQFAVYGTAIMLGDKNKMRELAVVVDSIHKRINDLLLNNTMD